VEPDECGDSQLIVEERFVDELVTGLRGLLGHGGVLLEAAEQERYLHDWRDRHRGRARCVVLPRTAAEVAAVLSLCNARSVAVYPQGGNTSVCGGSVPSEDGQGIVLSLERINRIRDVNPRDNSIVVEAGCVLATVQDAAREVDRYFPLSLGAEGSCQIGGNISTNAGGTSVLRYGNTRDLVLGLEVVLADGRILEGLRTLRKDNSGYDLKNLFIGAEGTLGIVTAAALKLFPLAPSTLTAMFALDNVEDAVSLGERLQRIFAGELVALELMSLSELEIVLRHIPGSSCPLNPRGRWQLLVELASTAPVERLAEQLNECVEDAVTRGVVLDAVVATSEKQRERLWQLRHNVTEANKREGMGLTHDIAVPVYRIPSFVEQAGAMIRRKYPEVAVVIVGHIGDGNLHYIGMVSHDAWRGTEDKAAYQSRLAHDLYDIAVPMGGTFSAEHGIGSLHVQEMRLYKNPVELALMRQVKELLDPRGIMNPGRVLPLGGT
jgi:FAD/FMN-containing dehydrogenase